ncbi:MAG: flagellin [Pseudomonadota bacterium]
MTRVSLGDMAQTAMLARYQASLKLDLQRASREATTGKVADPGQALGGDFRALAGIDSALGRLQGYRSANTEASMRATAMQTAIGTIAEYADSLSGTLLTASSSGTASQIDTAARQAQSDLRSVIGTLNARFADRSLFAGTATQTAPLPDADTWLASLQSSLGPVATAADVVAAIDTWFAAPTGFGATYQGASGTDPIDIAPGEEADLDVRATDPAIRATLRGLAMSALLNTGVLAGNTGERIALARRSAEALLTSASDRTYLAARIGLAEERIAAAATRNANEATALGLARNALVEADPYEAATRLEAAETQLKSIYSITARLSRLSLVDYI